MSSPQRYPNGVTNRASSDLMGQLLMPDPTLVHVYFNDFDTYATGDWTITTVEAGAGNATEALSDTDGGALLITNDDADNDSDSFQLVRESFTFASGLKVWFKTRLTLSDATQSDCVIGLHVTDTSPIASAPSDGVYFRKDDGDTQWDFEMRASSAQVVAAANIGTATTNAVVLGYYFDGVDTFEYYFNDLLIGSLETTAFPTTELAVSFAIQNGEAVAKTLRMDYIFACKER